MKARAGWRVNWRQVSTLYKVEMRSALRAYLRFASATRIEWAPELGAEKRLFSARP